MALPFKYTRLLSSRKRQHKKSLHTKLRYSETAEKEKKGKGNCAPIHPFRAELYWRYIGSDTTHNTNQDSRQVLGREPTSGSILFPSPGISCVTKLQRHPTTSYRCFASSPEASFQAPSHRTGTQLFHVLREHLSFLSAFEK